MAEVLEDLRFYEASGGGITLSGGEPMFQFEFALDIMRLCRNAGLHTCIETSGQAPVRQFAEIYPLVDLFLFDLKETEPKRHKQFTGASNENILANLRFLDRVGAKVILRCPMIPSLNLRDAHMRGIWEIYRSLKNVSGCELMPFHRMADAKYTLLGKRNALQGVPSMTESQIGRVLRRLRRIGLRSACIA